VFDPDLVVAWMAEHRSGRITALARDVAWAGSAHQKQAQNWIAGLQQHRIADIDWQNGRWTARECTLTPLPDRTATFLLIGARPDTAQAYARRGAVVWHATAAQGRLPEPSTIWWQAAESHEAIRIAASVGTRLVPCAAREVANTLSLERPRLPTPPPGGRAVERFNPETLAFDMVDLGFRPLRGLYKGHIDGNRARYMIYDEQEWYRTNRWEGIYLSLPIGSHPFTWRPESRHRTGTALGTLVIDRPLQLPGTHAETAVLCTGLPPRTTVKATEYDGVPFRIADQIARSLRRPLNAMPPQETR